MKPFHYLLAYLKPLGRMGTEFRKTFRSLNNRDFRLYTLGQLLSLSGTWMQSVALSWLVYSLTGSAAALGTVALASGLPMILLTYFGGMIADRFDRKRILFVTVTLHMMQAFVLALLTFQGLISVPWIIGLALFNGCIGAVEMPTRQSFMPELVSKEELTNAIGINSSVRNTTKILGPALGGLLIGLFGEAICFSINSLSYLASLITLSMITMSVKTMGKEANRKNKPKSDTDESILSVLMAPSIIGVVLLSGLTSMFGFQYTVLLPVIVDEILAGDATMLGFLSASTGIGALMGSLALANRGKVKYLRRGIGFASLILSLAIALLGFSSIPLLSTIALLVAGAAISIQVGGSISIVQTTIDSHKRGRVMAVFSLFMIGFAPFAAMMAGWLAEIIGVNYTLYLSSSAVMFAGLSYLAYTKINKIEDVEENNPRISNSEVIDTASKETIPFDEMIERIMKYEIVCVGETHDSQVHHQIQLQIIDALFARDANLGVGMEMFQYPFQDVIDRYQRGEISEEEFLKDTEYMTRWGFSYQLYKAIIDFCLKSNIPIGALNASKELTKRVKEVGIDGLSDKEKEELGPVDFYVQEHRKHWLSMFAQMHSGRDNSHEKLERTYQIMTIWDDYMAQNTARLLKERQLERVVVLAGSGHINGGFGIPQRASRYSGKKSVTIATIIGDSDDHDSLLPVDYIIKVAPDNLS